MFRVEIADRLMNLLELLRSTHGDREAPLIALSSLSAE